MATLLRFDGTEEIVVPANVDHGFSLQEAYALIRCEIIEVVYLEDGRLMLLDEESKLRNDAAERHNAKATKLLLEAGGMVWDYVSGNALICSEKEFQ